jgi:hypothetical protein
MAVLPKRGTTNRHRVLFELRVIVGSMSIMTAAAARITSLLDATGTGTIGHWRLYYLKFERQMISKTPPGRKRIIPLVPKGMDCQIQRHLFSDSS